jgi:tyrosinase
MHTISRRRVVRGGAFAAGLLSSPFLLRTAAVATTVTRYDLSSANGQAMLKIYAKGVGKMMGLAEGKPRGWLFQWYTHGVRSDRTKATEISRIYGTNPDADGQLAAAMWNTCEAHSNPSHEDFFLPWHRMYLLCFEQIVRDVTGEDGFTLPYWNYTDASQRALPGEFRKQNDPIWGPLYRPDRNAGVNTGTPIDKVAPFSPINLSAMSSTVYSDNRSDAGFCSNVDGTPHGAVHDDVGNFKGMGNVPWAANDPIFWMHHSNIDRIWASWNKAGGKNPSLTGSYTFADRDGKKVQLDVVKFVDADTAAALGYEYDKYLQRPPGSPPFPAADKLVSFVLHATSRRTSGPVSLGATRTIVTLSPPSPTPGTTAPATIDQLSASLKALPVDSQFILRLENVRADAAPGVAYDVYYGLREGQQPSRENPAYAGSLSFFGVVRHGGHSTADMPMPDANGRTYSFLITRPVQQALSGTANTAATVTLVPTGTPRENAAPTIGSISLISV